jgi:polysaccharide export outer membrane protein
VKYFMRKSRHVVDRAVPGSSKSKVLVMCLLILAVIGCAETCGVLAQTSVQDTSAGIVRLPATSADTKPDDSRYRIGPGDVLTIITRKAPELSLEAVRVDQRGMIRIPMIDKEVQAACHTENELSADIETLYREFKTSPNVAVFVKDFQSRPVAVIGAVMLPGPFRLQRRVRLLELISGAGGPSPASGRVVHLIHAGGPDICAKPSDDEAAVTQQALEVFKLTDTLKGVNGSNPFVNPGDIVSLPDADQIFVVGYVLAPRAIPLKDKEITVSRAIAMAGGPARDAKPERVRIVRQAVGDVKQELMVNLKAIQKDQAQDIVLLPNDVVEVPSSTGKQIINALTGAIAPAITQIPLRTIP